MIALRGLMAGRGYKEWWRVSSATCLCAWQAKGAASAAAAKMDLTGNGRHLTGADPTWNVGTGWSSHVYFGAFNSLLSNNNSFAWCGKLSGPASESFFTNSTGWNGVVCNSYTNGWIYCGYNADMTPRIVYKSYTSLSLVTFVYLKGSDNTQALYHNGSLVASPNGSTPTAHELVLGTGSECRGAAVYSGKLSSGDITKLTNFLNNL